MALLVDTTGKIEIMFSNIKVGEFQIMKTFSLKKKEELDNIGKAIFGISVVFFNIKETKENLLLTKFVNNNIIKNKNNIIFGKTLIVPFKQLNENLQEKVISFFNENALFVIENLKHSIKFYDYTFIETLEEFYIFGNYEKNIVIELNEKNIDEFIDNNNIVNNLYNYILCNETDINFIFDKSININIVKEKMLKKFENSEEYEKCLILKKLF